MKTLVEKYACLLVYISDILENCPEKWVTMHAAEISQDALTICRHQQMHCFLTSVRGKCFPWEFTDGNFQVCAALHGLGLWDLQSLKEYSISSLITIYITITRGQFFFPS